MKIAMVGQFPPHVGGVGVHIHTLARELVKKGHEVYVVTYPHKNLADIDGIHVIGTKGIDIPGLRGLMFKRNAKKALKELIKKVDIDIIHGHYLFPAGAAAVEVGKKYGITTYVTAHGSDMFELYKKQSFMRGSIKKILKNADHILAVSNALKDEIIATGVDGIENKIDLCWNSVDVNKFNENPDDSFRKELNLSDKPVVLFVGNIIKRKNVYLLIEAKKHSNNDYQLVIVGDGPLLNGLKEKVQKENISDVFFTGSRNDVEKIIPSCDVLVLPSFSESFGLVLIEALACGKPVIGSKVGGIQEIITPQVGLLINPHDDKTVVSAIDKILFSGEYDYYKAHARNRAMDFANIEIPYKELK